MMSHFLRYPLHRGYAIAVCKAQTNGSFERDLNGWTKSGNLGIRAGTTAFPATNGVNLVAFNGGQTTPNGVISQTVALPPERPIPWRSTPEPNGTATAHREQVSAIGTAKLPSQIISVTGHGANASDWLPHSVTFTVNSVNSVIRFTDVSTTSTNLHLLLYNVRVQGAVAMSALPPEYLTASPTASASPTGGVGAASPTSFPGDFTIRLEAAVPGTYVRERSEYLSTWEAIEERKVTEASPLEFRDPPNAIVPG